MRWIDRRAVVLDGHRWAQLISRAWADRQFHERLIAQPRAAVEEALGVPQKESKIRIVQDGPGLLTLVIPPQPLGAGES